MLNAYLKKPLTRERYRSSPAGPHLDAFIFWLEQRGYQSPRILRLIRGAHRLSQWAQDNGLGTEELDAKALEQFRDHFQGRQPLRYPSGSYRPVIMGARHFVTFLETLGLVSPTAVVFPHLPSPSYSGRFNIGCARIEGPLRPLSTPTAYPSLIFYKHSVSSLKTLRPKPSGPLS
jgi:hypothetical protein